MHSKMALSFNMNSTYASIEGVSSLYSDLVVVEDFQSFELFEQFRARNFDLKRIEYPNLSTHSNCSKHLRFEN